jgi:hypothetical protein
VFLLLGGTADWASARVPVAVSTCGQFLFKRQVGVLMNDLDCTGVGEGVFLEGAALKMNGHSIRGATSGDILCKGSCKVTGPGELTDSNVGIAVFPDSPRHRSVQLTGVDLHNDGTGINVSEPVPSNNLKIILTDVTSHGNALDGISCASARVRGKNVTTNGNAVVGLRANAATILQNFTSIGNSLGYDNLGDGPSLLRDSAITGSTSGVDLSTKLRPVLVDTTCEHSLGPALQPWGVCSGD